MKKLLLALTCTFIILLLQCTESSPSSDPLCISRLRGKVVSQGPACAGVAIQVLSGSFDPARVDTLWFDAYANNPPTYKNVFTMFPYCSVDTEQQDALLEAFEKKNEFFFIFDSSAEGSSTDFQDCALCKLLVSLPESTNRISIVTEECNDAVIYE